MNNGTDKTTESPPEKGSTPRSVIDLQYLPRAQLSVWLQPSENLLPVQMEISEEPKLANEAQPAVLTDEYTGTCRSSRERYAPGQSGEACASLFARFQTRTCLELRPSRGRESHWVASIRS